MSLSDVRIDALARERPRCKRDRILVKLHGEGGGPEVCMECGLDLRTAAETRRKRDDEMVRWLLSGFGSAGYATECELDTELLRDVLALTHPDQHPPERQELAHDVTARLTDLKRYVKPPPPKRDASAAVQTFARSTPVTPSYPCGACRGLAAIYYCDACRERWDAKRRERLDADNAKRRTRRAERRQYRPRIICGECDERFRPSRADSRYCSAACRQKAYRARKARP